MGLVILLAVVVLAGAVLSVQAAINGRLGETVGVLRSSLLTFAVGAVVTGLLILFFEPAQAVSLLEVPKWQLTGALFGVVYMMVMVGAVPVVGTAVATVAVIVGQLGMGMLIDNFGWLGESGDRLVSESDVGDGVSGGGFGVYVSEFAAGAVIFEYISGAADVALRSACRRALRSRSKAIRANTHCFVRRTPVGASLLAKAISVSPNLSTVGQPATPPSTLSLTAYTQASDNHHARSLSHVR